MRRTNTQTTAIAVWFIAGAIWLALGFINDFEVIYFAAAGMSFIAGASALFSRWKERRSDREPKKRGSD